MSNVKNILIIDDNALSIDRLISELDNKKEEFTYKIAEYLRPAIKLLKSDEKFDLILLDQNMGSWKTPDEILAAAEQFAPDLKNEVIAANRTGLLLLPWLVESKIEPLPKILIISQYGKTDVAEKFATKEFGEKFCGFQSKPVFLDDILNLLQG